MKQWAKQIQSRSEECLLFSFLSFFFFFSMVNRTSRWEFYRRALFRLKCRAALNTPRFLSKSISRTRSAHGTSATRPPGSIVGCRAKDPYACLMAKLCQQFPGCFGDGYKPRAVVGSGRSVGSCSTTSSDPGLISLPGPIRRGTRRLQVCELFHIIARKLGPVTTCSAHVDTSQRDFLVFSLRGKFDGTKAFASD